MKGWKVWILLDAAFSVVLVWVAAFLHCVMFLSSDHSIITISMCMDRSPYYRIDITLVGGYFLLEYFVFVLYCPRKQTVDVIERIGGLAWCTLSGALTVALRTTEDNGIPHDAFAGCFGLGLIFLGILAIDAKRPRYGFKSYQTGWGENIIFEVFVLLALTATLITVPASNQAGVFEFVSFTLFSIQKAFRFYEVSDAPVSR